MRGMDYARMEELISTNGPIYKFKGELAAFFSKLSEKYPQMIGDAYRGNTAELFNAKLTEIAKKMDSDLDYILNECAKIAANKQAEYAAQERKMQNSMD